MKISKPKLAVAMMKAGIDSMGKLAEKAGMTRQGLSATLSRNSNMETIIRIAKALECKIEDLVEA